MRLILASTSPFRQAMLRQAGLTFEAIKPAFDEWLPQGSLPDAVALMLAEGKAEAVADHHPDAVVMGADQVGECEGVLLGKPLDEAAAYAQLKQLLGRTHRLITGVVLIGPTPEEGGARATLRIVDETRITFRQLSDEALKTYVATREWEGCAGGYRLEGQGVLLVEKIEGDYFNIIGLPLIPVLEGLRRLGIDPLVPSA